MREKLVLLAVAAAGSAVVALESVPGPRSTVRAAERSATPPRVEAGPETVLAGVAPAARRPVPGPRLAPAELTGAPPTSRAAPPEPATGPPDIDALFRALRDDGVRWNATRAAGDLCDLLDDPVWCPSVVAGAQARLWSDDEQQRLMVTQLLIDRSPADGPVPQVVLDRALDWLGGAPALFQSALAPSAGDACRLCVHEFGRAEPWLVAKALDPGQPGHRTALELLAVERYEPLLDVYAPVLVESLADNEIRGDGLLSAWLLKRLGSGALPYLRGPYLDDQQAELAGMVMREIERPGSSRPERPRLDLSGRAPYGPVSDWEPRGWLRIYTR